MPHLYIVRGLPGSGKSTFARNLDIMHVESDMFRINEHGEYVFDSSDHSCHTKCQESVKFYLDAGQDVVVSNTFTRIWEMQYYLDLGYPFTVITVEGNHGNIHNVPQDAIDRMRARWEPYV